MEVKREHIATGAFFIVLALVIFGFLALSWFVDWRCTELASKKYSDSDDVATNPSDIKQGLPPAFVAEFGKAAEMQKKASESKAYVGEWKKTFYCHSSRAELAIAWFTFCLFVATGGLWLCTHLLAKDSRKNSDRQFAVINRPKLVVRHIHIWNMGKGSPVEPKNKVPTLNPGDWIEGAAFAINTGTSVAKIISSDCAIHWGGETLSMNHPGWRNSNSNRLKDLIWSNPDPFGAPLTFCKTLSSGETGWWQFKSEVPATEPRVLYVIGLVTYEDALNTRRVTAFARQYDIHRHRFDSIPDDNYEDEQ